jgi:large subunit ribosomal protein L9
MEVILKEDVNKLGHRGDVVKVADGYGRNYLLPGKLAIEATLANRAVIEQMKGSAIRKSAKEKASAEELAKTLSQVELTFERKVGENDHLFGSVTSGDIAHAARKAGLYRRPPQDRARGAAQVAWRIPCADQAAPRSDQPRQGDGQGRCS